MLRLKLLPVLAVLCCALVAPAAADADTYVDDDTGNDFGPCTLALPCQTVQAGVDAAGSGDAVRVDGGGYTGPVFLGGGKSLLEQEFNLADGDSDAEIGASGASTINVGVNQTAGTIQGFSIGTTFPGGAAVSLSGPATLIGNDFFLGDDGVSVNTPKAGTSTIGPDNTFDNGDTGISVISGSPTITDNTFTGLTKAISGSGNMVAGLISDNDISGGHRGIFIQAGTPTIVDNLIHDGNIGVDLRDDGAEAGAAMRRNRIFDHVLFGVSAFEATGAITFNSDVLQGNETGLFIGQSSTTFTEVSATNTTFTSNTLDVQMSGGALTLNSSIVEDPITTDFSPVSTCTITFSRGPTTTAGGTGCANFQTTAAPMFAPDGYHLLPGSPLIDLGDPTVPAAPNDLDFDGDSRAIDADGACPLDRVRDVGADEVASTEPTCPTSTPGSPGSSPGSPGSTVNPLCEELRAKVARLSRRIRRADDPDTKAKLRDRRRGVRAQLAALGCP